MYMKNAFIFLKYRLHKSSVTTLSLPPEKATMTESVTFAIAFIGSYRTVDIFPHSKTGSRFPPLPVLACERFFQHRLSAAFFTGCSAAAVPSVYLSIGKSTATTSHTSCKGTIPVSSNHTAYSSSHSVIHNQCPLPPEPPVCLALLFALLPVPERNSRCAPRVLALRRAAARCCLVSIAIPLS